jgi:hypothetical protein
MLSWHEDGRAKMTCKEMGGFCKKLVNVGGYFRWERVRYVNKEMGGTVGRDIGC